MSMNFFKRLAEEIRQSFKKEEVEMPADISIEEQTAIIGEEMIMQEEVLRKETEKKNVKEADIPSPDNCLKQMKCFLFKDGKAIGKPFGRHSEIRILYVNSFVEAFQFFLRLCDQRMLERLQIKGHLCYEVMFPGDIGRMTFTDKVTCRNKAVVATLKIEICGLQPQINEIRFETIKKTENENNQGRL